MGIAEDIKTLGEDIVASYDSRVKAIGTLVKDTHQMLKGFDAEHKEMSDNLKDNLEKGEADRLKAFKDMMGDINKGIKDIETYVENKLKEFSDAHADMSEELKKDLAKYVAGIVSTTKKLLADFTDEREKMAANWQATAATMARRRGAKPVRVEAGAEVKTVKEAVKKSRKKGKKRGRKAKK